MLWRCWLGGKKGIRPVKSRVVGCWCGCLSGARCRLAYGPADATALTVSCFSTIQIGFTFLVPAHLGSPGKRAIKRVCVCVTCLSVHWQLVCCLKGYTSHWRWIVCTSQPPRCFLLVAYCRRSCGANTIVGHTLVAVTCVCWVYTVLMFCAGSEECST